MNAFIFDAKSPRVVFGSGSLNTLPEEIKRAGGSKPLLLNTPRQKDLTKRIERLLNDASLKSAGVYEDAVLHAPISVTNHAISYLKTTDADCIISFGGGSVVGLGKAMSHRTGLYHITIPTTYSGSEMTAILGESEGGKKTTSIHPTLMPGTVIYDVDLTLDMPLELTLVSGLNALAHAVEALYAPNKTPVHTLLALDSARALATSLPILQNSTPSTSSDPTALEARSNLLYGAYLSAYCLSSTSMGLQHKLSHALGGSLSLPHADVHARVLPHVVAYNAPHAPEGSMAKFAQAIDLEGKFGGDAVKATDALVRGCLAVSERGYGVRGLGMKEEEQEVIVKRVMEKGIYGNPREVKVGELREVVRRVWAGEEARADL